MKMLLFSESRQNKWSGHWFCTLFQSFFRMWFMFKNGTIYKLNEGRLVVVSRAWPILGKRHHRLQALPERFLTSSQVDRCSYRGISASCRCSASPAAHYWPVTTKLAELFSSVETIAITLLFMRSSPSSILRVIYKIILEMHYCNFDFGFTSMFFVVFFFLMMW